MRHVTYLSTALPEQFRRPHHAVGNGYSKGAAALTTLAADTLVRVMLQRLIVGADRGGHLGLHGGKVIVFVHDSDVDVGGAGFAMATIAATTIASPYTSWSPHRFVIKNKPNVPGPQLAERAGDVFWKIIS